MADHLSQEGYQSPWDLHPWGKTYGTHSPMFRAYKADAKLLMIGVDYETSTYIHLVEVIHWKQTPRGRFAGIVYRIEPSETRCVLGCPRSVETRESRQFRLSVCSTSKPMWTRFWQR